MLTRYTSGSDGATWLDTGFTNVKDERFGAVGNGVAVDSTSIQAAVAAAKVAGASGLPGGTVYIPPGEYVLSAPITLPRTTGTPLNAVRIVGAGPRLVRIRASSSFPASRAFFEWDSTSTTQAWHQHISGLGFLLPNTLGVMAINYKPNDKSTGAACLAETIQIHLEDLLIEGSNQYHSHFIYLEGNVKASDFIRVSGDPSPGGWVQDTILIEFDTTDFGAEGDDSAGGYGCYFSEIHSMLRRGGYSADFKGRLLRSTMNGVYGQQSRTLPTLELNNSVSVVVSNYTNEGGGAQPQVKLSNSSGLIFQNLGIGSPSNAGSGVGNGMELVAMRDSIFYGPWRRVGNPSFTSVGKKMLTIDANCKRNVFKGWTLNDSFANEVTNNASDANDNYGEFYDIQNSARYTLGGTTLPSYAAASLPTAANNAGRVIYVSDGGAGAVFRGSNGAAWVNLG